MTSQSDICEKGQTFNELITLNSCNPCKCQTWVKVPFCEKHSSLLFKEQTTFLVLLWALINLSAGQFVDQSFNHFVNYSLVQSVILSISHFVNHSFQSFYQLIIFSYAHFLSSFCQFVIMLIGSFCQWVILTFSHFDII